MILIWFYVILKCPKWMEYLFVYLGVLVGMAGPFGMMKQHDLRDWAQRQSRCHNYLLHGEKILKDGWWQLNCDLVLKTPPKIEIEPEVANDRFYQFLERTWIAQQFPLAILLFAFGGLDWLVWGVCLRIFISVGGHWLIGHFAHNDGERTWRVEGAAVQGHNIRIAGLLSMGEAWHNNHHAYPHSARHGLQQGQIDLTWEHIRLMRALGLATKIRLPVAS